ncbi:MAG: hypothetical protein EOO90_10480 [Pedobacter sp.]|nr:MAG: hypothetical protein EOO90_10480 [Pedobacter sp.]
MRKIIALVSLVFIISACGNNKQQANDTTDTLKTDTIAKASEFSQKDTINAVGQEVLASLAKADFAELSKYFSEDGVRFSPYGYIDTVNSKKLTAEEFIEAVNKKWVLTWGSYDGTGDPIKLNVREYLKKFVYNADYLNAEAVGYNEVMKQGNSINNIKEIFPNHRFVDYHFSGFDQSVNGMDWTSLRLVFENRKGEYFLVAIIHDQWTI